MESHVLHIKNMVCPRCLWAVEGILNKLRIGYKTVEMGKVITALSVSEIENMKELKNALEKLGFELIEDKKMQLTEQIKGYVMCWIRHADTRKEKQTFSSFLASHLNKDYGYLSSIFSEVENTTIEKYTILQKIKKAKELIIYDELNFSEISFELGYSSPAYFSNQFKAVTGYSPNQFKKMIKSTEY